LLLGRDLRTPAAQGLEGRLVVGGWAVVAAPDLALGGGGELGATGPAGPRPAHRPLRPPGPRGAGRAPHTPTEDRGGGLQEPADPPLRAAAGAGGGPAQQQLPTCPGEPDVEQPTLLLDPVRRLRDADRQQPLAAADEEDHVPLQPLGRVQRRERDPLDRRSVLLGGPP